MKLKQLFNYLAYINVIISLGAMSLTYMTASLFSIHSDLFMYVISGLITFFVYSFNRFTDIKEDIINNPKRTYIIKKHGYLFLFGALVSITLAIIFSYLHSFLTLILVSLPALFVLIYSVKWLPKFISYKRLKEIPIIKNILVSLGWSIIPFYVSIYSNTFHLGMFYISIFIFLRIFIGVIMFDIRDIKGDKIYNIQTIPVRYGIEKSKYIILMLNILTLLIFVFGIFMKMLPFYVFFIGLFAFFMGILYIYLIDRYDINFLCNVIVDGEYVLLGLITFGLNMVVV